MTDERQSMRSLRQAQGRLFDRLRMTDERQSMRDPFGRLRMTDERQSTRSLRQAQDGRGSKPG
jgi:hypothetical protein